LTISIIAAASTNNVIGKDNKLIWRLPADMRFFKNKTLGHHVIMGRKTYESMMKPLPDRINIVISTDENYTAEGCIVVHSLKDALLKAIGNSETFIIGGAEIYRQAMALATRIYLTRIHSTFDGDAFFPDIDETRWLLTERKDFEADEKNPYSYSFLTYDLRSGFVNS